MGTNAAIFGRRLSEFAIRVGERADLAARKIVLDALAGVVQKTPVDTGRARGNWQVSALTPVLTELDLGISSAARGSRSRRGKKRAASAGISAGQAAALALNAGAAAVDSVDRVTVMYLSNNVSYIGFLENGSSRQAPSGMLRLTVQEIVSRRR